MKSGYCKYSIGPIGTQVNNYRRCCSAGVLLTAATAVALASVVV